MKNIYLKKTGDNGKREVCRGFHTMGWLNESYSDGSK